MPEVLASGYGTVVTLAAPHDQEQGAVASSSVSRLAVGRAFIWRLSDGVGFEIFSFIVFLALGRLLVPEAFGIVSVAGTIIQGCQVMLGGGFGTAVQQKSDLEPEHLTAALWANLGLGVVCALGVTTLAWPLSVAQGKPELFPVLASMAPALVISSLSWIYYAQLKRLLRYDLTALSTFASIIVGGIIGVTLAYCGAGVWSLVAQQLSSTVAAFVTLVLSSRWRPGPVWSWRHVRELADFATKVSAGGVLDFLSRRTDTLILGFFLSAHTIGIYFVAARLTATATAISFNVPYDMAIALLPRFQMRTQAFHAAAYRTLQFTLLFSLPTFIGLALVADNVIILLFGSTWSDSVRPLQVMCVFSSAYAFTLIGRQVLNAAGFAGVGLAVSGVNAALYVAAMLFAAPAGPVAAAAAGGIASSFCIPLVVLGLRRRLGLQIRRILLDQLPIWGAGLIMAASVTLVDQNIWAVTTSAGSLASLFVKAGTGFVVFAGALWLLAPDLFRAVLGSSNLRVPGRART